MRLLLDEQISPTLVKPLAELGVFAQSIPHVGLAGASDPVVWAYASEHDMAVVTANARDFLNLARLDIHPGLIVLRESELNRHEQLLRLKPVLEMISQSSDPDFMINKVVEVTQQDEFRVLEIAQ
jgi:predicted nuclease of predicted toxin-antitoxin system